MKSPEHHALVILAAGYVRAQQPLAGYLVHVQEDATDDLKLKVACLEAEVKVLRAGIAQALPIAPVAVSAELRRALATSKPKTT